MNTKVWYIFYGVFCTLASGNIRELHTSLATEDRHSLDLSFVKTALRYDLSRRQILSRAVNEWSIFFTPLSITRFHAICRFSPIVRCGQGGGEFLDIYCENRGVKINLCESRAQSRARRSVFRASRRAAKTRVEAVSLGHAVKYLCPVRQ